MRTTSRRFEGGLCLPCYQNDQNAHPPYPDSDLRLMKLTYFFTFVSFWTGSAFFLPLQACAVQESKSLAWSYLTS